jgi:flagellar biosynthesis protein FlhB
MEDKLVPNREVLALLREQGKVAWSRQATRGFLLAGLLSYFVAFGGHYALEVWQGLQRVLGSGPADLDTVWSVMIGTGTVVATTSLIVLAIGIAVSLVQTRLLLSIRLILPAFRGHKGPSAAASLAMPILGVLVGGWLAYRYLRDVLLVLRQPPEKTVASISLIFSQIGKTLIVVALIFAILSLIGARISFLWRHRMTKREMIEQSHK